MAWILAGLGFGFLGSFHCIGMCGPIALSLPRKQPGRLHFLASRLLYNLGRLITYATLGGVVGFLSRIISIGGYQQSLSIAVGSLLLLSPLWKKMRPAFNRMGGLPNHYAQHITARIKRLFGSGSPGSLFLIGLLNGLLPCGFVYMALATAATTGGILPGLLFMAAFGLGTFPAMLGISLAGGFISLAARQRLQKLSPYFIAIVGIILILRGLNLGIPFLSPAL
ncbi:sulfite exporter TauE/SafE family protein [Fodinibius sediminis]|uniref:Urease accessory protein UreH-like transmembrane domain-containing protein n=1 Tax=Fodinibius sediminis TaxID=1214077 RepID=A0A521EZQ1_9BACT|nr:sulfite exporter TauE/SafE family protein [Fodinibius sediminis]SMO88931.1 hypothetical protein SAMN06265218_12038 [Fodinibius sediminis]